MSKVWTQQDDDLIRRVYTNGGRISDCAAENGWTRGQIIGRAYRLGLSQSGSQFLSPFFGKQSEEGKQRTAEAKREWHKNNPKRSKEITDLMRASRAVRTPTE